MDRHRTWLDSASVRLVYTTYYRTVCYDGFSSFAFCWAQDVIILAADGRWNVILEVISWQRISINLSSICSRCAQKIHVVWYFLMVSKTKTKQIESSSCPDLFFFSFLWRKCKISYEVLVLLWVLQSVGVKSRYQCQLQARSSTSQTHTHTHTKTGLQ